MDHLQADNATSTSANWLNRDALLISLSAFFADLGYQAVTAVFPLLIVLEMGEPAYVYGLLLSLSYGIGSLFSLAGGKLGNRYSKKKISLLGNLLIPLMSFSALSHSLIVIGALFVFGWWARYFRSPTRRAWLVEVTDPAFRSKVFGFLHALDVGGGMFAVLYSVILVLLHFPLWEIMLLTTIPLLISSLVLALAGSKPSKAYLMSRSEFVSSSNAPTKEIKKEEERRKNKFLFRAVLASAALFGFSFYALGFPIVTVAQSQSSVIYGVLTFGIYLGVSGIAGYVLGSMRRMKPLRTLWSLGYLLAAFSSLAIGASYLFHYGLPVYYLAAAGLGFGTGSVETFEPVLASTLVEPAELSGGMGWLSTTRAVGLFVSNLVMGVLFVIGEFDSYFYAFSTALLAAAILFAAEIRTSTKE